MMVDCHRGGLAIDTTLEDPIWSDPESLSANIGEVWATFIVDYRVLVNDPYTIA
jgi:hypothetical protein